MKEVISNEETQFTVTLKAESQKRSEQHEIRIINFNDELERRERIMIIKEILERTKSW